MGTSNPPRQSVRRISDILDVVQTCTSTDDKNGRAAGTRRRRYTPNATGGAQRRVESGPEAVAARMKRGDRERPCSYATAPGCHPATVSGKEAYERGRDCRGNG
jgi:hypothetical protein